MQQAVIDTTSLKDEGIAIKGCNFIYAPKGQAGEYAPLACNMYRGCGHKCAYCYVPNVTKQPRVEFNMGAVDRPNYLQHLTRDAIKYQQAGITEQAMLSFTTDPFHPGDTSLTRQTLEVLRDHGLAFCTLTKGGSRALRDIAIFRPGRDAFASTLTTLDDDFSRKWESGAQLPGDRIATLRAFHEKGIFTWVSLEPTLDTASSLRILRETAPFVDLFKIGKANYVKQITAVVDWRRYTLDMLDLVKKIGVKYYFKNDLQPYLPPGLYNPKRIPQHH